MSPSRSSRLVLGESPRAWIALLIGVLAITAQTASSITVSVLMKAITGEFGWSRGEFATAATVRIIAMVVAMPLAGRLTDRFGARFVLAGGAVLAGGCILAMAEIASLPQLWMISVVMGPAQAFIGAIAANTLVLRLFERHRAIAIGILNGGDNLLNAGVPIVAGSLFAAYGWRYTLGVLAAAYLVLAAITVLAIGNGDGREAQVENAEPAVPLWTLVRSTPHLGWVIAVFAAVYAYITSLQLHFPAYQTDIGQAPAVAVRLLSVQILVGAAGAPLFGWLASRIGARIALVGCVAGLATSAGLVAVLRDPAALTAWAVFHGLVNSGVVGLLALVVTDVAGGTAAVGRLLGVVMAVCMGTTILGNQWAAYVFDHQHSYVPAWSAYAGLLVLTVPLAVRLAVRR